MSRFKDDSNERLVELVEIICKKMDAEDRGFIFAPMVQPTGNHRSFVIVADRKGHDVEETLKMFWTTMVSIAMNVNTQVPEDLRGEFQLGFIAFVKMCCQECFPGMETNVKMEDEND